MVVGGDGEEVSVTFDRNTRKKRQTTSEVVVPLSLKFQFARVKARVLVFKGGGSWLRKNIHL